MDTLSRTFLISINHRQPDPRPPSRSPTRTRPGARGGAPRPIPGSPVPPHAPRPPACVRAVPMHMHVK